MTGAVETNTRSHTFIVRVWLESRELPGASHTWRGVIEHVATGERRYFLDLAEIQAFIQSFLSPSTLSTEDRE